MSFCLIYPGGGGGDGGVGGGDSGVGGEIYGHNFIFKPHNDRYRYNRYADDVRSGGFANF